MRVVGVKGTVVSNLLGNVLLRRKTTGRRVEYLQSAYCHPAEEHLISSSTSTTNSYDVIAKDPVLLKIHPH